MGYPLQQANVSLPLRFLMVLSVDHISPATGKTPTVVIARNDGLGFVTPAGAVGELGDGWYQVAANATDAGTLGPVTLHATASGCDPSDDEFLVVNYNPSISLPQATPSSSSKSVADMLTAALLRINVIQSGEVPAPEDLAIAFDRFNDWIDSVCANERLTIYQILRTTFPIVSGQQNYAIGAGGDVLIARPIFIDRMNFMDAAITPNLEMWLDPLTDEAYQTLPQKTQTGVYPYAYYYNATYPTGTLSLFFVPTSSTLTGVLYVPTSVTRFGATSDIIALPPGYNRFMRDNLAVELASEFRENVPVDPTLLRSASESMANIKRANMRIVDLHIDRALIWGRRGAYNIYADQSS